MRRNIGQVALSLNILLSIFVIGSLGFTCYEISRILLAREQLRHCLELTALGGGVTMASTSSTGATARSEAKTVALNILKKNSILGQSLNVAIQEVPAITALTPQPGEVKVYFEFDDPITKQPLAPGQDSGVLKVYGAYAYPLFAGGFGTIGVSTYTLVSEATAGMPAIDLAIVYNNSGSMDDQTKVTMIRRYWDQETNDKINYPIPNPGGIPMEGTIAGLICAKPAGSPLNAMEPQNLDAAGDAILSNCPREFSEVGATGRTVPLRGLTQDSPPGDAPPSGGVGLGAMTRGPGNTQHSLVHGPMTIDRALALREQERAAPLNVLAPWCKQTLASLPDVFAQPARAHFTSDGHLAPSAENPWGADPSLFTDMVVNLDKNTHFNGYTDANGYDFPTVDYLVEAARGNLEDGNVTPNAWLSSTLDGSNRVGYKEAYDLAAYKCLEPKATVDGVLKDFIAKVARSSDCHFSFVSFADRAGSSPADFYNVKRISWAYPVAGNVKVALPQIPFDPASNNFQTITDLLSCPKSTASPLFVPNGGSNLAAGLKKAYEDLTSTRSRDGAVKAILVFTDKVPTVDLAGNSYLDPSNNGQAMWDAMSIADQCRSKGIPIFLVALDGTGQQTPYLLSQFDDGQGPNGGSPSAGTQSRSGLVAMAGNGGNLHVDTWVNPTVTRQSLQGKFNSVARQLLTLVQGQTFTSATSGPPQ